MSEKSDLISLRVRSAGGTSTVRVPRRGCVADLLEAVRGATGIAHPKVSVGFPPRSLPTESEESLVGVVSHGDVLTVESGVGGAEAASSAVTADLGARSASNGLASRPADAAEAAAGTPPGVHRMERVPVPDDNSCLFRAVAYAVRPLLGGQTIPVEQLRALIASAVRENADLYTEAFTGRPNTEYQSWIRQPTSWGGAIELSILSKHFALQIASFDVRTQRLDVFGEGENYSSRIYLCYDGIHYDPLVAAGAGHGSNAGETTLFASDDAAAEEAARALVATLHASRAYTDTANFTLMCKLCKAQVRGEDEAVRHSKATGHAEFAER